MVKTQDIANHLAHNTCILENQGTSLWRDCHTLCKYQQAFHARHIKSVAIEVDDWIRKKVH